MKATKEKRDSLLPKRMARAKEATRGTVRPHQPGQAVFRAILPEEIDWKPLNQFEKVPMKIGYARVSPGDQNPDLQITVEYQKGRFLVLNHRGGFLETVTKGKLFTRSFSMDGNQ